MKVCLDTEHCFAAGYDLADPASIDAVMDEFDREIGLPELVCVHANDSKVEHGSGVDRHENIGEGYIGIDGFEVIMGHVAFRDVPFILRCRDSTRRAPTRRTWTGSRRSGGSWVFPHDRIRRRWRLAEHRRGDPPGRP